MTGRDLGIADRLRAHGLTVVEVAGWQTRGSASFDPQGSIDHHTAGARTGNAPSLGTCINGRADLPGPLANVVVGRDLTNYVVAAGRCNHAGAGRWQDITSGNTHMYSVERENVGTAAEPWSIAQTLSAAQTHAALIDHDGLRNPQLVARHAEYALPVGRKSDTHGVSGPDLRRIVEAILTGPAAPPAEPAPVDPGWAFLAKLNEVALGRPTLKPGDHGVWVNDVQASINAIYGRNVLTVDAQYGPHTANVVRLFQKANGLDPDGVVGRLTWVNLLAARLKSGR